MKMLKLFIWAGFFVVTFIMYNQNKVFKKINTTGKGIVCFELSGKEQGQQLLKEWHDASPYLFPKAKQVILIDFLFLFFYSGLLFIISNALMFHERSLFLNTLLRMNLLLAPLAGLLDITENFLMLHNLAHYPDSYISSAVFAWVKFILAGWVVLVCLISLVKKIARI